MSQRAIIELRVLHGGLMYSTSLRISAIHGAKTTKDQTPWNVLLVNDYLTLMLLLDFGHQTACSQKDFGGRGYI